MQSSQSPPHSSLMKKEEIFSRKGAPFQKPLLEYLELAGGERKGKRTWTHLPQGALQGSAKPAGRRAAWGRFCGQSSEGRIHTFPSPTSNQTRKH